MKHVYRKQAKNVLERTQLKYGVHHLYVKQKLGYGSFSLVYTYRLQKWRDKTTKSCPSCSSTANTSNKTSLDWCNWSSRSTLQNQSIYYKIFVEFNFTLVHRKYKISSHASPFSHSQLRINTWEQWKL